MDENDDVVGRTYTITSTRPEIRPPSYLPLEGDEVGVWTTVFVGETCRASDADQHERVGRALDLAEEAVEVFRARMAVGREADNAENDACHGS